MDVDALCRAPQETEEHHGSYEAIAQPHDWWDWYAAYKDAREHGRSPEETGRSRRALHGGCQAHRRHTRLTSSQRAEPHP